MARTGEPVVLRTIRVRPGASRTRVGGSYGEAGVLVVAVREPAVDGRATEAVRRALADALGVAASQVTVVRGMQARTKQIAITAADPVEHERITRAWQALLQGP